MSSDEDNTDSSTGMKQPDERTTTNRDEMICPKCLTEGLSENPGYIDEYNGRTAILRATRCPNESCEYHYGVPESQVEKQMPESNIFTSLGSIVPSGISVTDVLTILFILAALVFMAQMFGVFDSETEPEPVEATTATISGITTYNGTPVSGAFVQLSSNGDKRTTETDSNGKYSFSDVKEGNYTISILPSEEKLAGPKPQSIRVTSDGTVQSANLTNVSNKTLISTVVQESSNVTANQTVGNANFTVTYENSLNAQKGVSLTLKPVSEGLVQRRADIQNGETRTLISPTPVLNQRLTVVGLPTSKRFITTKTYEGSEQEYTVKGNMQAKQAFLTLTNSSSAPVQEKTVRVTGQKTTTITVNSETTLGPVDIIFDDGTATATKQKTGTWNGDKITVPTPQGTFVDGRILIEPETLTQSRTLSGQIQGDQITASIGGNIKATNAYINFSGGSAQNTVVNIETASANAEGGTVRETKSVYQVQRDDDFRFTVSPEVRRNASQLDFWYSVNNQRTTVTAEETISLSLDKGDSVSVGLRAKRPTFGQYQSPHGEDDSPVEVTDIELSPSNPSIGQQADVIATLNNPTESTASKALVLYRDGEQQFSFSSRVGAGETIEKRLGSVSFNKKGTHTVHVTDSDAKIVPVGNEPAVYGVGSIEGQLKRVGQSGTIEVDTTGDGTYDCKVPARSGSCKLGQLSTGDKTILVNEQAVSGTQYTVSYTERTKPRDLRVDAGDDGTIDLQNNGILRQATSANVQLPPNGTVIDITTENDVPVQYGITWQTKAGVSNPSVYIDGELSLSDKGTFTGPQSFETRELSSGEHTIRLTSESGAYTARIQWQEQGSAVYPATIIDGKRGCEPEDFANNLSCPLPSESKQPGAHSINFIGGSNTFDYRLNTTAKAVPNKATVSINGEDYILAPITAKKSRWERSQPINSLSVGENEISTTSSQIKGIKPDVTATLAYSFNVIPSRNATITVINSNGSRFNKQIPRSAIANGRLVKQVTLEMPAEWFTNGDNTVRIQSENTGVVIAELRATTNNKESIRVER